MMRKFYADVYIPNTQERFISAFDRISDIVDFREEGYRITRISRKEVEERLGTRKLNNQTLHTECCGFAVHPDYN